ncbi:phage major capsid protein [Halomonas litopenaei]|uniref:phage major capsid protein n=1 Tax=Halomonas litopenaei TaxID=2109328 RepID=UPI001A8DB10A|nr:phage major capsid protein [Halomonas litopenaei]MBN8410698.1 phage major capsid protein [Halomonas litopenaei]
MTDKTNAQLLADATKQLEKVQDELNQKSERALTEASRSGQLSAETKEAVDRLMTTQNGLQESVNTLKASLGELEQEYARMPLDRAMGAAKSAGSMVAESDALKAFAADVQSGRRVSVPVNVLTSPDVGGDIIAPDRQPGIDVAPKQRLFIRDLIAPGRTASKTIYWVQQTGFTNNAAPVAENTTKPYSDIEFAEKITPVRTLAHLFKASKQILDDMPQLQSMVDAELRYGLKYVEEQQILFGDGTGQNLEGIVPQASAYSAAFAVDEQNGIDDLRLAMLQAQLARFPASGHVLHFIDWAKIELTKDSMGRYILANPAGLTGPTLWGLPVVATEAAAFQGKFLTGAFNAGAQIFDREDANVVVSTENADDFEKNMISIRCEERLALAVKRPEAFIYGDFTVPAP